jgi:DNA-binding NarL/FixJ family response regulator
MRKNDLTNNSALGRIPLKSVLAMTPLERDKNEDGRHSEKIATLTLQEREIIDLVVQGINDKQIADRIEIDQAAVRQHLMSIFDKLNVADRFELIIYAYWQNLARPPL